MQRDQVIDINDDEHDVVTVIDDDGHDVKKAMVSNLDKDAKIHSESGNVASGCASEGAAGNRSSLVRKAEFSVQNITDDLQTTEMQTSRINDDDPDDKKLALLELPSSDEHDWPDMRERVCLYESIRGQVDELLGRKSTAWGGAGGSAGCGSDDLVGKSDEHMSSGEHRPAEESKNEDNDDVDSLTCDTQPLDG
jgi:hypothetical protein